MTEPHLADELLQVGEFGGEGPSAWHGGDMIRACGGVASVVHGDEARWQLAIGLLSARGLR